MNTWDTRTDMNYNNSFKISIWSHTIMDYFECYLVANIILNTCSITELKNLAKWTTYSNFELNSIIFKQKKTSSYHSYQQNKHFHNKNIIFSKD